MLGLVQWLLRKAWTLTCLASLTPLALKATEHDVGKWHTSRWSWPEAAAPAAAVLIMEVAARCACARIRAGPKQVPHRESAV